MTNELNIPDIDRNEIYLLGDFNINLLQKTKYVLKENLSSESHVLTPTLVRQYKDFCQTYSLKQILREATRIACNSSSLIDHILSNCNDKIAASGVIDIGISDINEFFAHAKL